MVVQPRSGGRLQQQSKVPAISLPGLCGAMGKLVSIPQEWKLQNLKPVCGPFHRLQVAFAGSERSAHASRRRSWRSQQQPSWKRRNSSF